MQIERKQAAQMTECRVYERARCDVPTRCQPASASDAKEMRWTAAISNISQGGVLITLRRRFEKGVGLALELPGDLQRESTVVFVKVVHLRRCEAGWALGCKFISPLSEDEVQRLLTSSHYLLPPREEIDFDDDETQEL